MNTPCGTASATRTDAALLTLHLCATVASIVLAKAGRDALFLSRYSPAQLTLVDVVGAVVTIAAIACHLRLARKASVRRLLLLTPLAAALGNGALWWWLREVTTAAPPATSLWLSTCVCYLWVGLHASLCAPQSSVLVARVFSVRDSKRWCGVVGAGSIAGWIGGGLLTRLIATHAGTPELLLASAVLWMLCPLIVLAAWREQADPHISRPGSAVPSRWPVRAQPPRTTARMHDLWASPYLRAMASLAFLSSVVTTIVSFQFRCAASRSFGADTHLAAFIGSFNVETGLLAMVAQLVLTRRVLGVGLGLGLSVAPVAIAAGSFGLMFSGSLLAAVLLRGSDQVFRYSIDRAAVDLLYRPMTPDEVLDSKTLIESVIGRLGDLCGGLLVWVTATLLGLNVTRLAAVSVVLLAVWLLAAASARRNYPARLRCRLGHVFAQADRAGGRGLAHTWIRQRRFVRAVSSVDAGLRLKALRQLTGGESTRTVRGIERRRLEAVLAAEIVGLAVLVDPNIVPRARTEAVRDAIERIARLLHFLTPELYPDSVRLALLSTDPATMATAHEYLSVTLPSPHRHILESCLERCASAA